MGYEGLNQFSLGKTFNGIISGMVIKETGSSNTNVGRAWYVTIAKILLFFMTQSSAMGVLPIIRAAVDPDVKGAVYCGPGGRAEMRGHPVRVEPSEASQRQG